MAPYGPLWAWGGGSFLPYEKYIQRTFFSFFSYKLDIVTEENPLGVLNIYIYYARREGGGVFSSLFRGNFYRQSYGHQNIVYDGRTA